MKIRTPREQITQTRLKEVLRYNKLTGEFRWRFYVQGCLGKDAVAGTVTNGYRCICVDGKIYRASRLAWLYVHGGWPADEIDHRGRNKLNDKFSNLRPADRPLQLMNTSRGKGAIKQKSHKRWRACIQRHGKKIHLGYFANKSDAQKAYFEAKKIYHAEMYV